MTKTVRLVVCLLATFAAAAYGAQFMPGAWYESLNKPALNPPNWIFGPVWTVLYLMMAFAAWLAWESGPWDKVRRPLAIYLLQLLLNAAWSAIFFGMQQPDRAFAEICLLWAAILVTIAAFWRLRPLAGALLLPYLCWVSFAAYLNFMLWRLNS
jgi:translocator protein